MNLILQYNSFEHNLGFYGHNTRFLLINLTGSWQNKISLLYVANIKRILLYLDIDLHVFIFIFRLLDNKTPIINHPYLKIHVHW